VKKFSAAVAELGYYVYLYVDPRNNQPFYVGKGTGNRAFSHLNDQSESPKVEYIKRLAHEGLEPVIELLAFGLDEETAFKVEAAAIDLIGFENLTNKVLGHGSRKAGRMTVEEVQARLAVEPIGEITEPCALIKIRDSFPDSASRTDQELYDATRGMWKMNIDQAQAKAKYVLAIYGGVVREVYEVTEWLPANSTLYSATSKNWKGTEDYKTEGRIEFVGKIALESIRKKYLWKSVIHLYKPGNANPVMYS
jgi:hypothetical protein